jgi:hypothetical protein
MNATKQLPQCPECGTDAWIVVETNGAEYPDPLVETRECESGHQWTEVLTA